MNKAIEIFKNNDYTCVLTDGKTTYTSQLSGIAPMLGFLADGTDLRGFSVADKIIGKAAAMLFVLADVSEVYAPVMSEGAAETFRRFGISYTADKLIKNIINRKGDGICPMEIAVRDITEPEKAREALIKALAALKSGGRG